MLLIPEALVQRKGLEALQAASLVGTLTRRRVRKGCNTEHVEVQYWFSAAGNDGRHLQVVLMVRTVQKSGKKRKQQKITLCR